MIRMVLKFTDDNIPMALYFAEEYSMNRLIRKLNEISKVDYTYKRYEEKKDDFNLEGLQKDVFHRRYVTKSYTMIVIKIDGFITIKIDKNNVNSYHPEIIAEDKTGSVWFTDLKDVQFLLIINDPKPLKLDSEEYDRYIKSITDSKIAINCFNRQLKELNTSIKNYERK